MNTEPETVVKLVITAEILGKTSFIKRLVPQRDTGKLIPCYTSDAYQAMWFLNLEYAFTTIDLLVTNGCSVFTAGTIDILVGNPAERPSYQVKFKPAYKSPA